MKHNISELPVSWWVRPSVVRTFCSQGDLNMGTTTPGSNVTFSPSQGGTSAELLAGVSAQIRENVTLGDIPTVSTVTVRKGITDRPV